MHVLFIGSCKGFFFFSAELIETYLFMDHRGIKQAWVYREAKHGAAVVLLSPHSQLLPPSSRWYLCLWMRSWTAWPVIQYCAFSCWSPGTKRAQYPAFDSKGQIAQQDMCSFLCDCSSLRNSKCSIKLAGEVLFSCIEFSYRRHQSDTWAIQCVLRSLSAVAFPKARCRIATPSQLGLQRGRRLRGVKGIGIVPPGHWEGPGTCARFLWLVEPGINQHQHWKRQSVLSLHLSASTLSLAPRLAVLGTGWPKTSLFLLLWQISFTQTSSLIWFSTWELGPA